MKKPKKNLRQNLPSVDDTLELINKLIYRADVMEYLDLNNQFRTCHKCIDGFGINYSKDKILSVKFYLKIFDTQPKFSDKFLNAFLINEEFKSEFIRLCISNNKPEEHRNQGLTGVNTSLKVHIKGDAVARSIYRRVGPCVSEAITCCDNIVTNEQYKYIFNKGIQLLIKYFYNIKIPICSEGMEFYKRGEAINKKGELIQAPCATAYPSIGANGNPKHYLKKYFSKLQSKDPWEIESVITESMSKFNKHIIPITKGYQKNDLTRKIYLSSLSTKHSSINNLTQ